MAQQLTFGVRVNTAHGEATVIEAAPTKMASGEVIKVRYDRPGVTITNEANERVDELEVLSGPTCMAPGCTGSATHHIRWTEFFQAKTATSCAEHLDTMVAFLKREEDLEDDEVETVRVAPEPQPETEEAGWVVAERRVRARRWASVLDNDALGATFSLLIEWKVGDEGTGYLETIKHAVEAEMRERMG